MHDYYDLHVERVNIIENIASTGTIYTPEYIESMKAEPRPGDRFLGNRARVRTPWDFNLSCFKSYRLDNINTLNQCFDLDWVRMRLPRAIKEDEAATLKEFMRKKYKWFREVYKYQAGVDPQKEIMCISMNSFGAFAQELTNFVDMKTIKLADIDLEIISTNAGGRPDRLNPQNQLIRHQFMEVWIRLCLQKYVKSQYAGPGLSMAASMEMMFNDFLYPVFKNYDSHAWRKNNLWVEEVDYALKIAMPSL